jgi:minor tail protein Z (GPZ)
MIELNLNVDQWKALGDKVAKAKGNAPKALMRAINHTGKKAKTQMVRSLAQQTGLPLKTTRKALKEKTAGVGGAFIITSKGGNVRLKFFKAKETKRGVSAAPWNKRRVYPGTFMRGGHFPNRKDLGMGGAVVRRAGSSRYPMRTQKSGLFIPKEMVSGATESAFYQTAQRELPPRLAHELGFVIGKG